MMRTEAYPKFDHYYFLFGKKSIGFNLYILAKNKSRILNITKTNKSVSKKSIPCLILPSLSIVLH